MNKVFKVIWNHATQSWVAVSELASAKGKTKSKTSTLTALSVVVGSAMVAGSALAAVSTAVTSKTINQQEGATISGTTTGVFHLANGTTTVVKSDGSAMPTNVIVIGNRNDNVFDNQVLIGYNITSIAYGKAGDTVVGNRVRVGGGSNGNDSFSTAVGFGTQVAGPSVAIGVGARADIYDSSGWNATVNGGVAIGAFALQGGNFDGGTVIGALSSGDYFYTTSIGALSGITNTFVDRATDTGYTLQEGGSATTSRIAQTSIGYKAGARGARSVAIGNCATTGVAHTISGVGTIAIGDQSQSFKDGSIAIGQQAVAGGVTAAEITALNTEITRLDGLLTNATNNLNNATANLTANPSADNKYSVAAAQSAIKRITLAKERAQRDLAKASVNNSTTTTAMAIGYQAHANNLNTTAIGRSASSYAQSSISLGRGSGVTGVNATRGMALGDGAAVTGDSAMNSTAIGAGANIRQNSTNAIAFGTNASVVGDAVGSSNSIAIGNQTAAGNRNARWTESSSLARALTFLAAQNATAVGSESIAGGNNSAAFGYKNVINAPNSTAVGFNNTVGSYSGQVVTANVASANYIGLNTHVIGANNNVTANNTMVFGNNISVTQSNRSGGVVIGDNSSLPNNTTAVNSASVNNITYSGFAGNLGGTSTGGASELARDQGRFVSIGNTTSPRQLKHVAAGEIGANSTDAINGSQLYLLTSVVGNVGQSVANVIGGNATMYANGTVANFTQPLNVTGLSEDKNYTAPTTDADNVADAITNLNNYVNAGWIVGNNTATKVARISPNEQVNFLNGTATSAVATANGTGADITYNVNVDNTTIAVNGTSNQLTVNTTTLTNNPNGTVVTPVANASNLVNASQVAAAINASGWNTTLSNGTNVTVNPGDAVNYVSGNGTAANVTVNDAGAVVVSYDVNTTTGTIETNGTVSVVDGNSFLNASTVANLVNNAAFNVTTAKVDEFVTNQAGKANATVKAGGNITYTAGKNIAIKQAGTNFTFATEQNVTFTNANVTSTLAIGNASSTSSPVVNIKTENATTANVNNATTSPTAALNITSADGKPTQIKGVGSSLNTTTVATNPDGTDATDKLLDLGSEENPLSENVLNSVATVRDLTNLGWVVSANGNSYTDTVKNANEVKFNGVNGISVTGNTTDGVRNVNISLNTTTLTSNANGTTTVTNGNNYVNGTTVADAINKAGWNTTLSTGDTLNVNPGDQVNYVNGNGTTANVTTKTVDGKDVVSVSYDVKQTTGSVNTNGTVKVAEGNSFLNASTVADLVNNAAFNVTTAKVDEFVTNQAGKANATVKAGGNITYTAGKNIAISQNGSNFTFSTTKDIEVDSVTANNRVQIGSGNTAVNLTTDLGALQVADKDGNATQITNVEAGTNIMAFNKEGDQLVKVGDKYYVVNPETNEVDYDQESTLATEEELDELAKAKPELKAYVSYAKAASGLADLDNSEQTNALTVADAQRLGWVVSASGNDYADSVTNANEVRFNGSNGISVTGETDEHGVRNINVSIAQGKVAGNTTTGVAQGDTNYVTGDQVAKAINESGWKTNVTQTNATTGATETVTKVVTPGTQVNYVDGNSTKANVVVTKAEDGKETVNVSYDLVTEDHLTPVANDAKSVTKPTNIDANKGKDAATVNDVLNAGWNLQANDKAVDAVTHGNNVNFTSKDGSVKITATSNGSTSSLDFAVNATSIVNQVAGTISYNKDGKATTNGDGKRIATVGDVANTINNTGWLTNVTDAKGNVTTKVVTPNTQVNYVNGDGTKANVVANSTTGGLDVTFNVKSANPETLTVDGNGVKVNTGSITEATDVAGDANRGKVTVAAGEGNKVATVQNVANAINSASWTVKVADTQEEITTSTANDAGSSVRAGNEITHVAGKNLKVKRDGRNVTYALANDVSVDTVTAQNSIKVGAGNAATTVTSSVQDGVTEVKLADAAGKATRITNVAAGVKDTDAVNVSQLRNSNAQINQNIAHLNNKVNRMGKDLRAGIAGSNAAAGLPQVYIPGKSMVAAAAGTFKGQSAVAVGYSRASDNGKVILKLQGNANTRGDVGGSVGVGYQW